MSILMLILGCIGRDCRCNVDSLNVTHILLHGHTECSQQRDRSRKKYLDNMKVNCITLQLTLPSADTDRLAKD